MNDVDDRVGHGMGKVMERMWTIGMSVGSEYKCLKGTGDRLLHSPQLLKASEHGNGEVMARI